MSFLDAGVDNAAQKIDAGQEAQGSMSDVFVIARQALMAGWDGRQVRRGRSNRLYAGLLVVGHDRNRRGLVLLRQGRLHFHQLNLAIHAQDFGHLGIEFGIATLEIIAHLVRLDRVRREDLAQRTLSERREAVVSCLRAVFANVPGKQPRRPQLVRITKILGFPASLPVSTHSPMLQQMTAP